MMATNYAQASYQEIIDFSTVPNKVGVFGIHTPNTMKPVQMLSGFYSQFRQVKYLGCTVKVQPAATLPMDPLAVSFESSETTTDPRDLLNPIMVKGCHGETINNALDIAYRDNSDLSESLTATFLDFDGVGGSDGTAAYYSALSDPSFRKYSVLQPFGLKGLRPLVHKMVGTMPIYPEQSISDAYGSKYPTEQTDSNSDLPYNSHVFASGASLGIPSGPQTRVNDYFVSGTMFTSRMERLGWLDTLSRPQAIDYDNVFGNLGSDGNTVNWNQEVEGRPYVNTYKYNTIPKLFMSVMLTPPCYKSILTFRCVINHHFAFRGFMTARVASSTLHPTESYDDSLLTSTVTAEASATSMDTINGEATTLTEGVM